MTVFLFLFGFSNYLFTIFFFLGAAPITPLSPFMPHHIEFPDRTLDYKLRMENGCAVLDKTPNSKENELVSACVVVYECYSITLLLCIIF